MEIPPSRALTRDARRAQRNLMRAFFIDLARVLGRRAWAVCFCLVGVAAVPLAPAQSLDSPPPASLQNARVALRNKAPSTASTLSPLGSDAWQAGTPAPSSIARYAFAQVGQDFYIFGGGNENGPIANAWRYSATTDSWTPLADVPLPTEAGAAAVLNGKIYLAQGWTSPAPATNAFRIYDIATNTWSEGAPRPGVPYSFGAAAGAFNGKVFVVGGGLAANQTLSIYDVASNTWTAGPSAPAPFLLGGYTTVGRYLYLVGSFNPTPQSNSGVVMRLDMETQTWSVGPALPSRRADLGLASAGSKLFAIGGDVDGGTYFDGAAQVEELETAFWASGAWVTSADSLPAARQGAQAGFFSTARANGEIWSSGGFTAVGLATQYRTDNLYRVTPAIVTPTPTPTPT
ncbi:MAG TPA: kelch repeat-containing protein, partial [Chthoniobacterales bacterium]